MAVDNPTYFSVAGPGSSSGSVPASTSTSTSTSASQHRGGLTSFFRRKVDKMGSTSSASIASTSTISTLTNFDSERGGSGSPSITIEESASGSCSSNVQGPSTSSMGQNSGVTNQRRSFRNLFRSVSANSEAEKNQQFLNGDPRPSDVAPPSPYLPHRSHSHSENDRRRPGRKKILKSASELLSNDMVYCGLSGEESVGNSVVDGNVEVFLGVDDARYYNISATLPAPGSAAAGRRRHSIGTFLNKTTNANSAIQQSAKKIIEPMRQPDTIAPPVPSLTNDVTEPEQPKEPKASRRRRHRSASSKGTRTAPTPLTPDTRIDDVVLVSSKESEVAVLWVNYLVSCFTHISKQQGRPPFKVNHVIIEESRTPEAESKIGAARLRIIVVCPGLLEHVISKPAQAASLSKQLASEKVLAMMLGVDDAHVTDTHKAALVSYTQWRQFFVKDKDEHFVGDLMRAAVAVLGTSTPQTLLIDQTSFSVLPKKVKMGQSRVIALLNDPLQPEDLVSVVVDRCGEAIDVPHVKRRNPYTLQFSIPDRCLEVSVLVGVRISKNGEALGVRQVKCESRLRELDQILRANANPLEFMCQTLGFNTGDREQLDNWMVHVFQRNLPPHFNLLSAPAGTVPANKNHTSPEESPTLLHFAARFGLEKLAWQLLECPGGDLACDLKNVAELTPADLAEQGGHMKLAHVLRGYMQMNEFTNMYTYLKVMSESTSTPTPTPAGPGNRTPVQDNQEEYCEPKLLTDTYMVPPAARPVPTIVLQPTNFTNGENDIGDYAIAPTPTPVQTIPTLTNGVELPLSGGYMKMHPATLKTPVTPTLPRSNGTSNSSRSETTSAVGQNREEFIPLSFTAASSSGGKLNPVKSREYSGPQDELLEIINDFKNNVFTINEVEKLVDTWKNRNDVQQNLKEKQRQLMAMRDEYERIQRLMKDDMKRPTPFDRVRKFFGKGKKESKDNSNSSDEPQASNKIDVTNSHRPVSSLSLHSVSSSSSSGRMSMVSECSGMSLGDSGTHSDPEDRKRASTDREDGLYYDVPSAPQPFPNRCSPVRYTPTPTNQNATNSLNKRPPQPVPRPDTDVYYITCPPSGLPIHSFRAAKEPQTPNSPDEQPEYLDLISRESAAVDYISNEEPIYGNSEVSSGSGAPPPAPPGMCMIPKQYMDNLLSELSSQKKFNRESSISGKTADQGAYRTNSEETMESRSTEEYVESDVITEALSGDTEIRDITAATDLPEYVNVDVTGIPPSLPPQGKKLPAPPVPPRNKT